MKKPIMQEMITYAEACGEDNEDEWTLVNGCRSFRSRIVSMTGAETPEGRTLAREKTERTPRRRREAILVKVRQDTNWIDSYRDVVGAKSALKQTTGVRNTRAGHIRIGLSDEVTTRKVAENLKRRCVRGWKLFSWRIGSPWKSGILTVSLQRKNWWRTYSLN
jgi:hypothetical protein